MTPIYQPKITDTQSDIDYEDERAGYADGMSGGMCRSCRSKAYNAGLDMARREKADQERILASVFSTLLESVGYDTNGVIVMARKAASHMSIMREEIECARAFREATCRELEAYEVGEDWEASVKAASDVKHKAWVKWCAAKRASDNANVLRKLTPPRALHAALTAPGEVGNG